MMKVRCINNDGMSDVLSKGAIYEVEMQIRLKNRGYYRMKNDSNIRCHYYVERFEKVGSEYKFELL